MNKNFKRVLSVVLAVIMSLACFSVVGFAAECTHSFDESKTQVNKPYCDQAGTKSQYCTKCKTTITTNLPAGEHSWGEWEITKAATCNFAGEKVRECTVCPETEKETIPATDHNYIVTDIGTLPSCDEEGRTAKKECEYCGDVKSGSAKPISKTGHVDADKDSYCDSCDGYISEAGEICSCPCHAKEGIMKTLYKIVIFLLQLFKIGDKCGCGATHYEI